MALVGQRVPGPVNDQLSWPLLVRGSRVPYGAEDSPTSSGLRFSKMDRVLRDFR